MKKSNGQINYSYLRRDNFYRLYERMSKKSSSPRIPKKCLIKQLAGQEIVFTEPNKKAFNYDTRLNNIITEFWIIHAIQLG